MLPHPLNPEMRCIPFAQKRHLCLQPLDHPMFDPELPPVPFQTTINTTDAPIKSSMLLADPETRNAPFHSH